MKELYIHAGLHKTGTTYIQKALKIKESELLKKGVLFPVFMRNSNGSHHNLSQKMRAEADNLISFLLKNEENKIILSAEDFSIRFWNKDYVEFFRAKFANRFSVNIILYFRRQDEHKESVFSEIVKTWYQGNIYDHNKYDFDFKKRIDFLSQNYPEANIIIRPYHRQSWVNKNIFSDLMTVIDPALKSFLVPDILPQNIGHRRLTLFLSTIEPSLKNSYNVKKLSQSGLIKNDNMKFLTSPQWRKSFMRQFQKSNDLLCKLYPSIEELFKDITTYEDWAPPSPISSDEYANAIKYLKNN